MMNCSLNYASPGDRQTVRTGARGGTQGGFSHPSSPMSRQERRAKQGSPVSPGPLSRDEVLLWLLRCEEDDASWVLRSMASGGRAHTFAQLQANELLLPLKEEKDPSSSMRPLKEREVISWLQQTEEALVSHALGLLAEERLHLLEQVIDDTMLKEKVQKAVVAAAVEGENLAKFGGSQSSSDQLRKTLMAQFEADNDFRVDVHSKPAALAPIQTMDSTNSRVSMNEGSYKDHSPSVGLTALSYFSHEGDHECCIEVMRLGNLDEISCVRYRTKDWSAVAGKIYEPVQGELVFRPGEDLKEVNIAIYDDDCWHTTLEFIFELEEEGCRNCHLDYYLSSAKVKVIDNDAFPTNKFKDKVFETERKKEAPFFGLFMQYIKMNMQSETVGKGTYKHIALDQLHNVFFVLKLFMNIYLVDKILKGSADELWVVKDKEMSLFVLAAANIVPFFFLFLLDQLKFGWKVAGASRTTLQSSLLRKFLNYDENSRSLESKGDLLMAMTRDSTKLVHDGYMSMLSLIKECGKIICVFIFQCTAPLVFERPLRMLNILLPTFAFPILLLTFLKCRSHKTTLRFRAMNEAQDEIVDYFDRTVENYRLIADYTARSRTVDAFELLIQKFNRNFTATSHCLTNNLYFPKWTTMLIVSAYIIYAGKTTIAGDMTLGIFLADVAVFTQMGEAWGNIYQVLLEMQTCNSALRRITRLENLPTDLSVRSAISMANRSRTKQLRQELKGSVDERTLEIDMMPIEITGLHLPKAGANLMGQLSLLQGQLVALVGNRGQGKATLLKVLGNVILPLTLDGDPHFFMPSHLRCLHVSLEPMFFKGTLFQNITFGATGHTKDGDIERVEAICKKMRFDEKLLALLRSEQILADWVHSFSQTQRQLCNIARVFVANPEVMCIHKPTQVFDDEMSDNIMELLLEHVKQRGLFMPDEPKGSMRRPRTCIFTSSEWMNVHHADSAVHVSNQFGIRLLDKSDVTKDMLC